MQAPHRPPGGRRPRRRPARPESIRSRETRRDRRRVFSCGGRRRVSARVGVFGATGYTGREAVRLLRAHPRARIAFTTGSGGAHLAHEKGLDEPADAYLLALPHGVSARYAARLRDASARRGRGRPLGRPAPAHRRVVQAVVRAGPRGAAPARPRRVRAQRDVPRAAARRAARVEPGLLRDVRAAAARAAAARAADRSLGRDRRRQERRQRRRAARCARTCSSASSATTSRPTRRAARTGTSARSRPCSPRRPAERVELTFCPHLLPVKRGILTALYVKPRQGTDALRAALHACYDGTRLRARRRRQAAAALGGRAHERLPHLGPPWRGRARSDLLRARQPGEGRGRDRPCRTSTSRWAGPRRTAWCPRSRARRQSS